MEIRWAQNPLRTVVELNDFDKTLLRERIKIEHLENCIDSAYFQLNSEMRAWRAQQKNVSPTLEEEVDRVLKILDIDYNTCEEPRNGKTLDQHLDERLEQYYLPSLREEHCGDCTCIPCSCMKCHTERLLKVDTLAGLGKHEATKIQSAFKGKGGSEELSISEALEKLKDYTPVYTFNHRWPEEEWRKHVPRWTEEGRRAYEWLLKYQQEHFK